MPLPTIRRAMRTGAEHDRGRSAEAPLVRRRSRGQALAEFALLLPVFFLIVAGTLDLGRVFYAQISLTNAAREGAVQAADTPSSFQAGQPCDTDSNLVMCRVLLEAKDSFVDVEPADVSLECVPADCARAVGNTVTVTVQGSFVLLTPLLNAVFGGQTLSLSGSATAQVEVFTAAPSPSPTATPSPDPSAATSPSATPECVSPPNIIGWVPEEADALVSVAGLVPLGYGDLTKGDKNRIQEQNPDATQCVTAGSTVTYHYRPN